MVTARSATDWLELRMLGPARGLFMTRLLAIIALEFVRNILRVELPAFSFKMAVGPTVIARGILLPIRIMTFMSTPIIDDRVATCRVLSVFVGAVNLAKGLL